MLCVETQLSFFVDFKLKKCLFLDQTADFVVDNPETMRKILCSNALINYSIANSECSNDICC